jgi:transposase
VFLTALGRMLPRDRWGSVFVRPETIRCWHRALLARRWTYPQRRPGRPATDAGVRVLILRLAQENPGWGYRRIQRELTGLGVRIASSTVWSILQQAGIAPQPRRSSETWRQFLRVQASGIVACNFFSVDTVLFRRCTRSCSSNFQPGRYIWRVSPRTQPVSGQPSRPGTSSRRSSSGRSRSGS